MAKVRKDLEGSVLAVNQAEQFVHLTAGEKIPKGYFVGGHAVEDGDPADQTPPWKHRGMGIVESVPYTDPLQQAVDSGASPEEILAAVAERLGVPLLTAHAAEPEDASSEDLGIPPQSGRGSGDAAWHAYATAAAEKAGMQIEIPGDAKKADIIEALKGANIPVE